MKWKRETSSYTSFIRSSHESRVTISDTKQYKFCRKKNKSKRYQNSLKQFKITIRNNDTKNQKKGTDFDIDFSTDLVIGNY